MLSLIGAAVVAVVLTIGLYQSMKFISKKSNTEE